MERKEEVPNDVLTRTIGLASKLPCRGSPPCSHYKCVPYTEARDGTIDVENLVDHFLNFHSGGRQVVMND